MSRKSRRQQYVGNALPRFSSSSTSRNTGEHPYGAEWPTISAEVKKRDNYTCQAHQLGMKKCSQRLPPPLSGLLHAHHVIPYAKCKKHDKRFIITLCGPCHQQVHDDHHINAPKASKKQLRWAKSL